MLEAQPEEITNRQTPTLFQNNSSFKETTQRPAKMSTAILLAQKKHEKIDQELPI